MPTMGKRVLACRGKVSFSKLEVIFRPFLPIKGVLERVEEDNFVNLLILFIRVREDFSFLSLLLTGFVFFFIRIKVEHFPTGLN